MIIPPTPREITNLARKARALDERAIPTPSDRPLATRLRRRLSPEKVKELVQRYQAGEHSTTLSHEAGVSKSAFIQLLRSERVELRRRPIMIAQSEKAARLYRAGLTIQQVAKHIDCSYGTVQKTLHRQGIVIRKNCIKESNNTNTSHLSAE